LFATQESVPEADIIVEGQDDTAQLVEAEFQDWLKNESKDRESLGKGALRKKRNAFYKLGFNDNHIPH
jgi:hypothetical protein